MSLWLWAGVLLSSKVSGWHDLILGGGVQSLYPVALGQ